MNKNWKYPTKPVVENLAIGYMKKNFCPDILFDTLPGTEKGIIMLVTLIPAVTSV